MDLEIESSEESETESILNPSEKYSKPRIFEGIWKGESLPDFDAIMISLDGRAGSFLEWGSVKKHAYEAIRMGYGILWKLDLGLFDKLSHPLHNQTQFLSLALAIEHFLDFIWKELKGDSLGLVLYQGHADFIQNFPWNEHDKHNLKEWLLEIGEPVYAHLDFFELLHDPVGNYFVSLFCRTAMIEYLTLLANRLPDSLPVYLFLNAASLNSSIMKQLSLLNPEYFSRFYLAIQGNSIPLNAWGWGSPNEKGYVGTIPKELPSLEKPVIGVCLPPSVVYQPSYYEELAVVVSKLIARGLHFKIIPEAQLTTQWDGLDYLLFCPSPLSVQGKRKLQGFCAAGGISVSTGSLIGLPHEILFSEWFH